MTLPTFANLFVGNATSKEVWKKVGQVVISILLLIVLLFTLRIYVYFVADRPPSIVFINNTQHQLVINSGGVSMIVAPSQSNRFPFPKSQPVFDIELPGTGFLWRYTWFPISSQPYVIQNCIFMQIEPDGS